ncbi:transposase domain-containing protein [Meridianimarinicoccus sp. MJW13]|uniref:transposase domain-containing protein n=1 Tax=Meridianimarinicoccus sp. MJW13 TaxID=2720031 RepID=UPI0037439FAE
MGRHCSLPPRPGGRSAHRAYQILRYLKATLEAIAAAHPASRIDELLPWNFTPSSLTRVSRRHRLRTTCSVLRLSHNPVSLILGLR